MTVLDLPKAALPGQPARAPPRFSANTGELPAPGLCSVALLVNRKNGRTIDENIGNENNHIPAH
jgi:hypothetical protein